MCTNNYVLEVVKVYFIEHNTLIYEELTNQSSHGSLDDTTFEKIFKFFFCFATEDLYIEGAIGDDVSKCQTLYDLCMCLVGLVGCED